jgi:hypothetical protein
MEFKIYKAGGETVIAWNEGGVRIASPVELAMWDRIAVLERALNQIAGFQPGTFWSLTDEIKIHETARAALGESNDAD